MKAFGYVFSALFLFSTVQVNAKDKNYRFIVGTYTSKTSSEGIYTMNCNFEKAKSEVNIAAKNVFDPSFLAMSANKKYVYAISERGEKSTISSFAFNTKNGQLTELNRVAGKGADPCYVAITKQHVITANYNGGNVCVFERKKDGSISEAVQNIQHQGKSLNSNRQEKPHVHQTIFSKDKKFVLVNDLGTDYITCYSYNKKSNTEVLTEFDKLKMKAGSGPRHLTFSKNGKIIYLLHELDGSLSTISFENGKLKLINETSIAIKKNIVNGAADIHVSPDGKFLYATNRGTANDISCFSIDKKGKLSFIQQLSVMGETPRNFTITNDAKYLLVANQNSHQVVVFKRNKKTGMLTDTSMRIDIQAPVCLVEY